MERLITFDSKHHDKDAAPGGVEAQARTKPLTTVAMKWGGRRHGSCSRPPLLTGEFESVRPASDAPECVLPPTMPTQNQTAPSSAGTAEAGTRSGWISQHGLLAYTLIAYGITWTLLIAGFFGTEAGVLVPDGHLVALMIQLAAGGPLIAGLIVISFTRGRRGLADLARRLVRWRVNPIWYAFIFLGVPFLEAFEFARAMTRSWLVDRF
jgi:hypothetical protein